MKKLLVSAVCMMAAYTASAEFKPYAELKISENFGEFKAADAIGVNDNGVLGGALAIGTKIDNVFRIELEGFYNDESEYNIDLTEIIYDPITADLKTKTKGFFVNAYLDFPLENAKKWTPYIGAGLGYSWLEATPGAAYESDPIFSKKYKDKDWAWNIGFGVAYEVKEDINLTLSYRHESLGSLVVENTLPLKYTNDKVSLGLRVNF